MLKIVVTLTLLLFVHSMAIDEEQEDNKDTVVIAEDNKDTVVIAEDNKDTEVTAEDKLNCFVPGDKFVLPKVDEKVLEDINTEKCLDKSLYEDESTVMFINTEADYLCAFIAFQVNKDTSAQYYKKYADEEEATWRFENFKNCVDLVNDINVQDLAWWAEINYFCDMTEEEKASRRGLVYPDEAGDYDDTQADESDDTPDGSPPPINNVTPSGSVPADITPADITPADSTPADITPADSTPADSTPADSTPADSTSSGSVPVANNIPSL